MQKTTAKPMRPSKSFKDLDMSSSNFMSQPFEEDKGEKPKDLLENRVDGLYVCLISLHGLVRGDRMELGKDPDTGGQVDLSPHSRHPNAQGSKT